MTAANLSELRDLFTEQAKLRKRSAEIDARIAELAGVPNVGVCVRKSKRGTLSNATFQSACMATGIRQ